MTINGTITGMKFWNEVKSKDFIEGYYEGCNETTQTIWHKDGVITEPTKFLGNVYRNGELADTQGKHELLTIVFKK